MRRHLIILTLWLCAAAGAAPAADVGLDIAGDRFRAAAVAVHEGAPADDVLMAGEAVRVLADVAGDALLAARRLDIDAPVAGDLYAAAMDVAVRAAVGGDATVFGYDVTLGAVGGDLRASGARVSLLGDVGGYALVAADDLRVEGVISGPAHLSAKDASFGPGARIDGPLVLYESRPGRIRVPESVAPEDRIERRTRSEFEAETRPIRGPTLGEVVAGFLIGVAAVALLATLAAALAPATMAALRARILARPFASLWQGFLAQSVLIGGGLVVALTLIGLLVTPVAFLVAVLGGVAGYVVGAYALGVGLLGAAGRSEPATLLQRALAASTGAVVAALVGLIPFVGWLFVLALALTGAGAIAARIVGPRFFAAPAG
ncbi:hypothetical protein [Rhodosalinus sp. 5P4]|uniref:hypothetical protein n=1 Tax=Rhodosalinus sp. 5P4 TaxID=3239196 RepID=UPI003525A40F